ncbi:hypothetical protein [Selenomonas sp. oral taxon 892]|jgi:hypothetical protein|uniref:hypothetical protein n=1 Tax=Selenomonas sp. oral taxon 892 TaxID=1321785 RepID=UPI0003AD5ABA|nr:hypothetical protein [Selenomonas sp. oral taxon 892]ERJ90434.1 hypothetical protein HMPREF1992_01698 [Selenomonas sp. oral taxon 892 str. F0426]
MAEKTTRSDKVKKLALNIDAAEEIGMLEISSTQAMRVSIIRSRGRRYTAITPFYRKRVNDLWKPKASVWIPVEHTGAIAEFLARAEKKIHEDT